jgi:hypothetical protein
MAARESASPPARPLDSSTNCATSADVARPLYLDTSAILRATREAGTTPEIEQRIGEAEALVLASRRLSALDLLTTDDRMSAAHGRLSPGA